MKIRTISRVLAGLSAAMAFLFFSCNKKSDTVTPPPNKIAFVYKTDNTGAQAYKTLLDANGCEVTLVEMAAVATHNFSVYKLIIVGENTA
ncbi:MAG TPA: hypothetical protein VGO58_18925, partial [Chitinophagaceae bacterium]|nr:hypothetical protein [Chitinophagaceae bacterium]